MFERESNVLKGKYKIIKLVGKGSYGCVYKAVDIKTSKEVAIKRMPNVFDDLVDGKRILRELALLKQLKHPNIVNLIEVIIPDNDFENFNEVYLVLEYAPGDLRKLLQSKYFLKIDHIL